MSKFGEFETNMCDLKHLLAGLAEMGFDESKIELHDEPVNLYGYHGDMREEKSHVVIRRRFIGALSNDLGFVREANGTYRAIISDYDRGRFGDQWMGRLKQEYSVSQKLQTAKNKGYVFQGREVVQTQKGPEVKLRFSVR